MIQRLHSEIVSFVQAAILMDNMADISTQLRVSNLMEQALSLFDGEEEQQIVIQYLEHAAANHICMQVCL